MATQRQVKIRTFDLVVHSWYIGRPASFGTQSTVSIMSLVSPQGILPFAFGNSDRLRLCADAVRVD